MRDTAQAKEEVEAYLLECKEWIPTAEICARFNVTARQLRVTGLAQGLCSGFAISGDKGFKHVACATRAEWLTFKHRLRKHGIRELVRVRDMGRVRGRVIRELRAGVIEKDSGQAVMAI